ncbi:MAG: 4-(cytidine 5'-diphospho)-2-C-methyl-D-erythritol kinase [Candidatus Omnitrophota bacterium]
MNLKSFAKVNLYLQVINKRLDSYHSVRTVFERISLFDSITLKKRKDNEIRVSSDDRSLPAGKGNLCFKAAKLLRDQFYPSRGLDIKIIKRIPVGAGLGGGSSNAAVVLLGLNKLWGLKLSKKRLAKFAVKIGSDVPFFIYEKPFAYGFGRGEKIEPIKGLNKARLWHLLIVPKIHVSTPLIYDKWDSFTVLTKPSCNVKILTSALSKNEALPAFNLFFNSLEQVTIKLYPQVKHAEDLLLSLGLNHVLMSGSGPAVFGIVPSRKKALKLAEALRRKYKTWRFFAVSTA